jgi:uncharacterized membrane protein
MAKQTIGIGSSANDGTGDPLRTAFDKINDNFTELYGAGAAGTNIDITGNSITSVNTNGNITLDPNGTGKVVVNTSAKLNLADFTTNSVLFSNSSGDVTQDSRFKFNATSGTLAIEDLEIHASTISSTSSNENITLDPTGTGKVVLTCDIEPSTNAARSLGSATKQWATVFGSAGTFQTTSANSTTINPGTAPGSPTNGMIYYDSTAHKFKGRANGAWVDLH